MANLTNVTDNYFAVASETYESNLSATIAAGAAIVPVNTTSAYTNGDVAVLTVDPGTVNEATFIGVKNGNQFEECVWTEGNTGVGHTAGATIIDYDSATHFSAMSKGIRQFANQDGTLKTQPVRDALALGATATSGWEVLPNTLSVSTGYNKGNREYDITVAGANLSSTISAGMKLRMQRATTAPTQSADLEASSTQYASRASGSVAGITFTDDFTIEANVKIESYMAANMTVLSRFTTTGFLEYIDSTGRLVIQGTGAASRAFRTYQSVPLGRWTHIAATLDMSGGAATVYFDGISVPVESIGAAGTSLTQAGDLSIGTYSGTTSPFDGKIADVRLWNTVRSQLQIRDNMNQQLIGTETNLIGYWKLNGNFNDSTANVNHLTGSGGAVATDTDNPMKDTEYAIVTKVSYSAPNTTLTVFTGTDHNIPNMTLNAPYYSTQRAPYGFPAAKNKWISEAIVLSNLTLSSPTMNAYYNIGSFQLAVPTGEWEISFNGIFQASWGAAATRDQHVALSTVTGSFSNPRLVAYDYEDNTATLLWTTTRLANYALTSQTPFYLLTLTTVASANTLNYRGDTGTTIITAQCAYV